MDISYIAKLCEASFHFRERILTEQSAHCCCTCHHTRITKSLNARNEKLQCLKLRQVPLYPMIIAVVGLVILEVSYRTKHILRVLLYRWIYRKASMRGNQCTFYGSDRNWSYRWNGFLTASIHFLYCHS
jgi:hypothetical protein